MPPATINLTTLARLSGLKLRSRHVVEGLLAGEHRGGGQGLAVEFAQLRPYVPGDELRRIDWRVFARTDKLHVRQYEEEVDLCVYLLLDARAGMGYRGQNSPLSKFEYAQILAGVNAYLALRQNDSACWGLGGTGFLSGQPVRALGQWQAFLDVLDSACRDNKSPSGSAPISQSISAALSYWKRKGLVIIFSDWFDNPTEIESALKQLRAAGHDCRVYQVIDRDELQFPFSRRSRFVSMDAGETPGAIDAEPTEVQKAYQEIIARHSAFVHKTCDNLEIDYRMAVTDAPVEQTIRGEGNSK